MRAFHRLSLLLSVASLAALLSLPASSTFAQTTTHIVQPGENLFRIGLRYGVSWQGHHAGQRVDERHDT